MELRRPLIIAYGNPIRSDDGVAWHVADMLRKRLSSDIAEIVCAHQLMPEFAEIVSHASGAIFIDARENGDPGQIYQAPVATMTNAMQGTHIFTPAQLMALCSMLYGNRPEAYEVSVTGECFSHGQQLSDRLKNALPQIAAVVMGLVRRIEQRAQKRSTLTL